MLPLYPLITEPTDLERLQKVQGRYTQHPQCIPCSGRRFLLLYIVTGDARPKTMLCMFCVVFAFSLEGSLLTVIDQGDIAWGQVALRAASV